MMCEGVCSFFCQSLFVSVCESVGLCVCVYMKPACPGRERWMYTLYIYMYNRRYVDDAVSDRRYVDDAVSGRHTF